MPDPTLIPVAQYLSGLWPTSVLPLPDVHFLDDIWMEPPNVVTDPDTTVTTALLFESNLELSIPGLDAVRLVIAPSGTATYFMLRFSTTPVPALSFVNVPIALRFSHDILQPARQGDPDANGVRAWEVDPTVPFVDLQLASVTITIDFDGNIAIQTSATINLPPALIGQSGVAVEAADIGIYLDASSPPPGKPAGWRGVHIGNAAVHLPSGLSQTVGTLALTDAYIGNGGFSGSVSVDWNPPLAATIGGMQVTLANAGVTFVQNALTEAQITGTMQLPFFNETLDISLSFGLNGDFSIELTGGANGLVSVTKPGILEVELESLAFAVEEGVFVARLSGTLRPLFGGLDWPGVRVQELSIDSQGHVRLQGGWLNLHDQYQLDLFGFQLEITRLGLGSTSDGGKWVGFSGGLKLVDGMHAGASVDGLRLTWYEDGRSPRLSLDGVGVEFEVPGVIRFQGEVSYRDLPGGVHRFDGDIRLELISLDLEVDGQLVIGYDSDVGYSFFAIYLGIELPAGIPLWTTGLGLYGLAGLFALNMEPDKQPNEPWYGMGPSEGWYKRPQIGVTDLAKWRNELHSVGIGAGVTIGTVADNGFTFNGRFLLALIFPGPILLIEGKANILKSRTSLADDPLLRALVVIDGRAGTFTIGLDARYEFASSGELIDISASAEAFFAFTDPMAWHLYLGMRDPRERRIRAAIFERIFEANAYFMLDAHQLALGAYVGYSKSWDFGPVHAGLEAWIEGNAVLGLSPAHFHGDLWLHGRAELSVFGFGFDISADARISADVFDPFEICVELTVHLGLPWPLPDFDVDLTLQWGPDPVAPPLPVPLKEIAIENFKVTTSWPLPLGAGLLAPGWADADGMLGSPSTPVATVSAAAPPANAPVVPLDARPHLTFSHTVHDDALVGGNPQPPLPNAQPEAGWEWIGDPAQNQGAARMRIGLAEVALERWSSGSSSWVQVARKGSSANPSGVRDLFGSWAPVPQLPAGNPGSGSAPAVGQTKLWLWSRSPFDYARHTSSGWSSWFSGAYSPYPCVPIPDDKEYCCDFNSLVAGSTLSSPWACPDVPWIALGWPSNVAPWVEPFGNGEAVCFDADGVAEFRFAQAVTKARLLINTDRPHQPDESCIDLRDRPAQTMANPAVIGDVVIAARDPSGTPPTVDLSPAGLLIGLGARISLPPGTSYAEITVHGAGAAVIVSALAADGSQLDYQKTQQEEATLVFAGRGPIAVLDVVGDSAECVLLELCTAQTGGAVRVVGRDWAGIEVVTTGVQQGVADLGPHRLGSIQVEGLGQAFCLIQLCVTQSLSDDDRTEREQMAQHVIDETARWSANGFVLDPYTSYRLKVTTTLQTADFAYDNSFNTTRTQTQFAYFQTDGPPAIANLSVPENTPDPTKFNSGLDDLVRYVTQTVPPTVPSPGQQPPLPRPVFRAYDVGVQFNEDYVDQLYRASGRDLAMYLSDNNNRPARDSFGRLLIAANRWGQAEQLSLTETDRQWIDTINASSCAVIDTDMIEHSVALATDGQVLAADTVYNARLVPRLLHEAFAGYPAGTLCNASAPLSDALGGWHVIDSGTNEGPSSWIVGSSGTPPAGYIEQQTNIWGGPDDPANPTNPGTVLIRSDNPSLPSAHPDQPSNWTDYRITAVMRSHDDDAIGLVVRFTDADNHYLFAMDRQRSYRRLVRVEGGAYTILASDAGGYAVDSDTTVTFECLGSHLGVFVDGDLLFDVDDATHAMGAFGLYCWANVGAHFSDVTVDDFRGTAPVPYAFSFTTSRFTDFYHQLHSGNGDGWHASVGDAATLSTAVGNAASVAALPVSAGDAERRAYDAIAAQALGSAAHKDTDSVETTILEADAGIAAVVVRAAEPIDWTRAALDVGRAGDSEPAAQPIPDAVPASGPVRIADWSSSPAASVSPQDESVTLILDEQGSLEGWHIDYRTLPSVMGAPDQDGDSIFADDFAGVTSSSVGDGATLLQPSFDDLAGFTIEDPFTFFFPHSNWSASGGLVTQTSPIGGFGVPLAAPGTLLIGGDEIWSDYALSLRLANNVGQGAIGVQVRRIDDNNYYRFSLAPSGAPGGPYRRLVKRSATGFTVLWQDAGPVVAGTFYDLGIDVVGSLVRVEVDGVEVCSVHDTDHRAGGVALYTYRTGGAVFARLSVVERITSVASWQLFERGPVAASPQWVREGGALRQTADLAGGSPAADALSQGTYAIAGAMNTAADVRIDSKLYMAGADQAGVLFRWLSVDDFQAVLFDARSNLVGVIDVVAGAASLVWSAPLPMATQAWHDFSVEAIGSRIRVLLDGAVVSDNFQGRESVGKVGVFSALTSDTAFGAISVSSAMPAWMPYTTFSSEGVLAAGRRVRVFAGQQADVAAPPVTAEVRRYLGHPIGDASGVRLPDYGVDLRLADPDGVVRYVARFAPSAAFANLAVAIARSADGTGFALVVPDGSGPTGSIVPAGRYRLSFTYRRDNTAHDAASQILRENGDSSPEEGHIDIEVRPQVT